MTDTLSQLWGELRSVLHQPGFDVFQQLLPILSRWPSDQTQRVEDYVRAHLHNQAKSQSYLPPQPMMLQWIDGKFGHLRFILEHMYPSPCLTVLRDGQFAALIQTFLRFQDTLEDEQPELDIRLKHQHEHTAIYQWLENNSDLRQKDNEAWHEQLNQNVHLNQYDDPIAMLYDYIFITINCCIGSVDVWPDAPPAPITGAFFKQGWFEPYYSCITPWTRGQVLSLLEFCWQIQCISSTIFIGYGFENTPVFDELWQHYKYIRDPSQKPYWLD